MPSVYNAVDSLLFPSWYEGFGSPPLEAMACGIIIVNAGSLPEVVGDAGYICAPDDVETLSERIREVLEDSASRSSLIEKGLWRANQFTWDRHDERPSPGGMPIRSGSGATFAMYISCHTQRFANCLWQYFVSGFTETSAHVRKFAGAGGAYRKQSWRARLLPNTRENLAQYLRDCGFDQITFQSYFPTSKPTLSRFSSKPWWFRSSAAMAVGLLKLTGQILRLPNHCIAYARKGDC
jgi:hypothetical protein